MPDRELTLESLCRAVDATAGRAMDYWASGRTNVRHWEKEPGQPVCDADLMVDEELKTILGRLLPSAAWLSEETVDSRERMDSSLLWVVDPIDGTRDFVRGRPGWAVSVALVEKGIVKLAVLSAPARGETWAAELRGGARRNGTRIHASRCQSLAGARMPSDHLPGMYRDLVMVEKPNSIALRMAMVAAGEADLVSSVRWGNEWDIAAAALIASEAGAAVSDALGDPLRFNRERPVALGMLCCAPAIHPEAVARLRPRALKMLDADF